eukprot:TRINITY_DN67100_c2_g1_i1.p1 TRINITY_DN67100_c2_g1~~TRINITY_DN67100_c2_g1_i1.p1  ORF type:complete len:307 (-),score=16.97 TRINITY_DN67100_c2_g1_i1:125-1045(-)
MPPPKKRSKHQQRTNECNETRSVVLELPVDVWGEVFDFLNLLERECIVRAVCTNLKDLVDQFRCRYGPVTLVVTGLQRLGLCESETEAREFVEQLSVPGNKRFYGKQTKTATLLSGSFVLWCVLGYPAEWTPRDVDVFGCGDRHAFTQFENFLYNSGYKYDYMSRTEASDAYQDMTDKRIECVREYFHPKTAIMVNSITVALPDVQLMLDTDFDLDFCKCHFDGKQLILPELKSVLTKHCVATWSSSLELTKSRIKKYRERGFTVDESKLEHLTEGRYDPNAIDFAGAGKGYNMQLKDWEDESDED